MGGRSIKAAARYLVLSISLAAAGDRLGAIALGRLVTNSEFRMSRAYRGGVDASVVVLGDSRGVNAIHAESASASLGMSVFNLAYNGMSIAVAQAVLDDYLALNPPPRTVILEVTSLVQTPAALTDFRPYAARGTNLGALYATSYPSGAMATRVSSLFRYNSEIVARAVYYRHRSDQGWTNRQRISPDLLRSTEREPPWRLSIRPDNLNALAAIAQHLRARHIELRLLVSPYLPAHRARLTNLDSFKARIAETLGADLRIWDYSNAIADTEMFADRLHMNERGSLALLRILSADGFFDGPGQPRAH